MSENYANVLFGYEENNLNEYLKIIRRIIYTPYGKWIKEGWIDEKAKNGIFVKVVSYNILAQSLLELHPELYSKHDKRYLCWERLCVRFHRLLMNNFTMSVVAPASSPNILIPEKFENKPNSFNNVPFAGSMLTGG
ncbi:hypothetical protein PGB90_008569 [Kerria lacca]